MPRKKNPTDPPSFEDAVSGLEDIVTAIEEEQLPLEELVAKYQQGIQLLARCESVLASARKRLQTIAATHQSAATTEEDTLDADPPQPHDPASDTDGSDDDDDIRLF